jgi:hypothetical protein
MEQGLCKLTRKRGVFVKSHIIPKAFTRPSVSGNYFVQGGDSKPPKKRWDSWYDKKLVIRRGEDVLSEYDDFAVEELRRLKLVWQSWEPTDDFTSSITSVHGMPSFGLRKVICKDKSKLRLFFLSLLWRAASTHLTEFSNIKLNKDEIEKIRKMLINRDPGTLDFYPTTLLQISSKGHIHNFIPIVLDNVFDIGSGKTCRHHVFRFYFDGLIAHIHHPTSSIVGCKPFIVGCDEELIIQQQLYEDSFQRANLQQLVFETEKMRTKTE